MIQFSCPSAEKKFVWINKWITLKVFHGLVWANKIKFQNIVNDKCRKKIKLNLNQQIKKHTHTRVLIEKWSNHLFDFFFRLATAQMYCFYCCYRCHCLLTGKFGTFICIIYTTLFFPARDVSDCFVCFVLFCLNDDA